MKIKFSDTSELEAPVEFIELVQKRLIDNEISFADIYINYVGTEEEIDADYDKVLTFKNPFGDKIACGTAFIPFSKVPEALHAQLSSL